MDNGCLDPDYANANMIISPAFCLRRQRSLARFGRNPSRPEIAVFSGIET